MKIALHICCAICAAGAAERLIAAGHEVHGYFYNPNIYPEPEYQKRLESAKIAADKLSFPLTVGAYLPAEWYSRIRGFEGEPETGKRCPVCFKMRLEKAYEFMLANDCEAFTSTLTMGSNKPAVLITKIGFEAGGERFLSQDFKKKEGFKRAIELAGTWGLYHQNYCGCEYSLKEQQKRMEALKG